MTGSGSVALRLPDDLVERLGLGTSAACTARSPRAGGQVFSLRASRRRPLASQSRSFRVSIPRALVSIDCTRPPRVHGSAGRSPGHWPPCRADRRRRFLEPLEDPRYRARLQVVRPGAPVVMGPGGAGSEAGGSKTSSAARAVNRLGVAPIRPSVKSLVALQAGRRLGEITPCSPGSRRCRSMAGRDVQRVGRRREPPPASPSIIP
jgi:hypothetical protein